MGSLPSHSISRSLVYTLALHSALFMGALKNIRTHLTADDESAFKINGNEVFFIVGVVALLAAEVTSVILFWTNIMSNYYAVLKFIAIFSANLAPFSMMMVMDNDNPPERNSMFYLLGYIIYGIAMAYLFSGDNDYDRTLDKSSYISIFTYFGLVLVPVSLVLVLFSPKNVNWVVVSVIYPTLVMEALLFLTIFFKFMIMDDDHIFQGIQQDKKFKFKAQQDKDNKDMEAQQAMKSSFT